ncbi:hypothetical protein ACPV36_00175 [Photobacterium damselae]|uniref:hypothetical protein n=1 Tax=Photobacterium damselae TaxID=38293 RepID=UPI00406800AE
MEKKQSTAILSTIIIVCIFTLSLYIYNFYNYPWSKHPEDWGTIGDYLGGILNPIISAAALFYLIKAYLSQKKELEETKSALEETSKNNQKIAENQSALVQIQNDQKLISHSLKEIEIFKMKIDLLYKELSFFQQEMANAAMVISQKGRVYGYADKYKKNENIHHSSDEYDNYREFLREKMSKIKEQIKALEDKIPESKTL